MRQAILYGAGDLRIEDRPLDPDTLRDDEVYVETEVSALSTGTDLGNYLGHSTELPGAPDYPRTVGYSNVGIVRRTGSKVTGLTAGQRVFSLKPHQSAYIAGPADLLVPVPSGVLPEQASLAYLTELGVAALRQARYEAGENVAVIGLGVIGLATIGMARVMGARVAAIANSPERLRLAHVVGAHASYLASDVAAAGSLRSVFGETGADIIILTANTWDAYRLAVDLAAYRGRVSVLGFPGRGQAAPAFNPLAPEWFYGKQLTLIGAGYAPRLECAPAQVRFNLRRNLEYILESMASGDLSLEQIITHSLPAARMQEVYELARQHSKQLAAAVFDWRI
ncbi:MAG TPA: zinc-binding alcohol dehydrogenase [Bryobacteraceae bacterium]|nr:zinc-binding alcohol dehydrogenase [Bryobacteraceae bacterium]